ncbi:hypothetical protein LBMAG47_06380 [Planctomycetia bacterium]|nr:hypothetical protein LBMAG47_06380 [Planctomycetia bacterium]
MCTYANDTWCRISGLRLDETRDHRWSRVIHPDDLAMVLANWEESVVEQRPYVNEVRIVRPGGSLRHIVVAASPAHDARGGVSGFLGTALDVTDRRAAENEAREKESLIRALVDHSSAAIYLKDRAGRYLLVNRQHRELWPARRDFRPGTTPFDWFPEETARSFLETDALVFRTGETRTFEELLETGGERRTFMSIKFPVFDDSGTVMAVGGISADISDLERLIAHGLPEGQRPAVESVIEFLAKGIEDGRRVIRGIRPAALDDLGLRAAFEELAADLRDAGIETDLVVDPGIDALPPTLQTIVYRIAQESLHHARRRRPDTAPT